jgi:hypothetical protein
MLKFHLLDNFRYPRLSHLFILKLLTIKFVNRSKLSKETFLNAMIRSITIAFLYFLLTAVIGIEHKIDSILAPGVTKPNLVPLS